MPPFKGALLMAGAIALAGSPLLAANNPTYPNVTFGTAPRDSGGSVNLRLDIYKPPGVSGPTPVVVWIHGGGWFEGSRSDVSSFAFDLLDHGISIASVDYRLSGQAIFPAQIWDVKGAVRFLRAHGSQYGLDTRRMASWGDSAGGHLSALLATSGGVAAAEGAVGGNLNQSSRVMAFAEYFGPIDLMRMATDETPPVELWYDFDAPDSPTAELIGFDGANQGFGVLRQHQNDPNPPYPQKMALVNLANPINHISPDDPRGFIAHGAFDNIVPIKQSQRFYNALDAAGLDPVYDPYNGDHDNPDYWDTSVNPNAINFLVEELTRPFGDANCDGFCDVDDLAVLAMNWGQIGGWRQGDFTCNGLVNIEDLRLLAQNWEGGDYAAALAQVGLAASVPEPLAAGSMLILGMVACARRRRRA